MLKRAISILLILIVVILPISGQTSNSRDDEKVKEQEETRKKALSLVDDILKESQSLKHAENRIKAQVSIATILWKHNEKRARELLKTAVDGFLTLLRESPVLEQGDEDGFGEMFNSSYYLQIRGLIETRAELKQLILDALIKYEPKSAREFMRAASNPANQEISINTSRLESTQNDLNLAARLVESDPAQALQIAEESLAKELSNGIVEVWALLQKKDKDAASRLLDLILKKLRAEDLAKNEQAAIAALALIGVGYPGGGVDLYNEYGELVSDHTKADSKEWPIDEKITREIVEILVSAAMRQAADVKDKRVDDYRQVFLLMNIQVALPKFEKYLPGRAAELKKFIADRRKSQSPQEDDYSEIMEITSKGDADSIFEAAGKASPEMRSALTSYALEKATSMGEVDRARQIINEKMTDATERKRALMRLDQQIFQQALQKGDIDIARQFLPHLSPDMRAAALIQLAMKALEKKEKKAALELLVEADGLFTGQPSNVIQLMIVLQLAQTYVSISPERSFDLIEPLIDQLNTLVGAIAALEGFDPFLNFIDGELGSLRRNPAMMGVSQTITILGQLSRADFDRAKGLAERFARTEIRLMARVSVAQGILDEKPIPLVWNNSLMSTFRM